MQKLFLTASFVDVATLFQAAIATETQGMKVVFIPTAANCEAYRAYVDEDKVALQNLGMVVDELDISQEPLAVIQYKIEQCDCIYVSGGNTFYLLDAMKKSGAFSVIKQAVNAGKWYIGASAGSVVTAPNIQYIEAMDDQSQAPSDLDLSGLHLVDVYVVPHVGNEPFVDEANSIIHAHQAILSLVVLSNTEALLVKDGQQQKLGS